MTSQQPLRIVIAGGGTGGHVLPAISVIEELERRGVAAEYLWIGTRDSVEQSAAARKGIAFAPIAAGKLRRYASWENLQDAFRIPLGGYQAMRAVRRFNPSVIFSTGGFVSVPTVLTGFIGRRVLTHEQTTTIGLATKLNALVADLVALSYEQSRAASRFRAKTVVTGNPVRLSLLDGNAARGRAAYGFSDELPLLYVTGGARGSTPINRLVEALLPSLLDHCQILHQTGSAGANDDAARLTALRATWPDDRQRRYRVVEFVGDELADVYAATSLVLARAGAGTIAELPLVGKPALFIPLPNTSGDEQTSNARLLAERGAAVVLAQSAATPERLRLELLALLSDPVRLGDMANAAKAAARPDAAARLADLLIELANR